MKLTLLQIITLVLLIAFIIYELWYLPKWMKTLPPNDPVIRTDLILFVPVLAVLLLLSAVQEYRKKK